MEFAIRLLGALVVTYAVSRLALKLFRGERPGVPVLIGVHLGCFVLIAFVLGLMRAYVNSFEWSAAQIYILPQLAWLALDIARRR